MKTMRSIKFFGMLTFSFLITGSSICAQDTFSICAVDPATGQVGSAGATCITSSSTSAIIISDVHPGVGVIHTQASYVAMNQTIASGFMNQGLTPQQIIDSMMLNDWHGNPSIRQYGIVSLDSGGLSAAHTGQSCLDYKNHITGPGYAIQGNILLGQQILDSMESRFLNTTGTLACRLMAALQGANVVGADTRCTNFGISSYSAFIRVANPTDSVNQMYLDLTINTYPGNKEPIDSLQQMFDLWGGCAAAGIDQLKSDPILKVYPNPAAEQITVSANERIESFKILDLNGRMITESRIENNNPFSVSLKSLPPGIYFLLVRFSDFIQATKLVVN